MRTCKKCGKRKPLDQFELVDKERGWRRHECRACVRIRVSEWAERSKDRIREWRKRHYRDNREKIMKRVAEWVAQNPDRRRKNALSHYYRLQHDAVMAYGGYVCACCGETEPLFLTIDHVRSDGAAHRKRLGSLGGARFYKWLRDNGYPPGFQVLCMNCNHGRHRNGGKCPHKEGVTTIPKGSRAKRPEAHSPRKGVKR